MKYLACLGSAQGQVCEGEVWVEDSEGGGQIALEAILRMLALTLGAMVIWISAMIWFVGITDGSIENRLSRTRWKRKTKSEATTTVLEELM